MKNNNTCKNPCLGCVNDWSNGNKIGCADSCAKLDKANSRGLGDLFKVQTHAVFLEL